MYKSLIALIAGLGLIAAMPAAHADIIKVFNVAGTADNISGGTLGSCTAYDVCAFSGTLNVDVTNGTATGTNIMFPGLPAFDTIQGSGPDGNYWVLNVSNSSYSGDIKFQTGFTPASLLGFDGGDISYGLISSTADNIYFLYGGSITAPATAVPEPNSLLMMLAGLGVLGLFLTRRRLRA